MKDKKKPYKIDSASKNIMGVIQDHLTKHGKIKGNNKRETLILLGACIHHTQNSKGKLKPTVWNPDGRTCKCRMCKYEWGGEILTKDKMKKEIEETILPFVNQYKYLAVASNAGAEAVKYGSELGSMLMVFPNNYNKIAKVVKKKESVKKKKSSGGGDKYNSSLGGWRRH